MLRPVVAKKKGREGRGWMKLEQVISKGAHDLPPPHCQSADSLGEVWLPEWNRMWWCTGDRR